MKSDVIREELAKIAQTNGGVLRPQDVVAAAKGRKHPLHECFEWSDDKAAMEYRLWQARQLIRVTVHVLPGQEIDVRTYVSMMEDRTADGGGYRLLVDVLSDTAMREKLLEEALAELGVFQRKYQQISELAGVFAAARRVRRRRKPVPV